jgi:UDP-N-acetylglucosamine--dolichyl-phosphate N-acetylglucosaminephosphotransferase
LCRSPPPSHLILIGINGLEVGQSYIIACSILFFKLYELQFSPLGDAQLFSLALVIPFIAVSLGLLRHNWFPASVFVGDTYCYFAGMTFAVIGIHGHFSKTILLLFIPQIFNFVYSIPQLFKVLPCPRHRLPRVNTQTQTLYYSAFPCAASDYKLFKVRPDDTECPNCTIICAVLRVSGPLKERSLCLVLLGLQIVSSCFAFFVRYYLFWETPNN